ncbi:MAG: uncharacterized membrane protein YbhN (UPF0104 family) [Maribacter sp.]
MVRPSKAIATVIKLIVSGLLVYFIFSKIDIKEIGNTLSSSNPYYLGLALVFFISSKIIASFRLNLYFHQLEVFLTQKSNLKLYFLGMFYNLFLPGGIGGDAYKGYAIKKKFDVATKKVVSVLVLDRLSGLLLLFLYACSLLLLMQQETILALTPLFLLGIPIAILVFWLLNRSFFSYALPVFWKSVGYSALVQLAQLISVWFIMKALAIEGHQIAYLVIFLISSFVSVIPLTIGGIGSREATFFYGASLLGLNDNISVGISIIFFLITALVSLAGIWYHFKKIDLETVAGTPKRNL